MGIEYNAIRAILTAKKYGATLDKTITIGRQGLYENKKILERLFKTYNISIPDTLLSEKYAEKILSFLGGNKIDSLDYSDYEHATILHDMNKRIDESLKNSYDFVFDGGTLEHVFNFPVAIKNCMDLLKKDGFFVTVTVCNNFPGHGFYQFSPELFYRIFNNKNGFKLVYLGISEKNKWYKTNDPEEIKERVTFKNKNETYLIAIAQKIENVEIFKETPQQSDYVEIWQNTNKNSTLSIINKIKNKIFNKFITYNKKYFTKEKI